MQKNCRGNGANMAIAFKEGDKAKAAPEQSANSGNDEYDVMTDVFQSTADIQLDNCRSMQPCCRQKVHCATTAHALL